MVKHQGNKNIHVCVDGSVILKFILNKISKRKIDLFGSVLGEVEGCVEYENVPLISKMYEAILE